MSLTVSTVTSWNPSALDGAADELDAARRLTVDATDELRAAATELSSSWDGEAADAARRALSAHGARGEHLEAALSLLRRVLRVSADAFAAAQSLLNDALSYAASHGLTVQENGTVAGPPPYIVSPSWTPEHAQAVHDEHQDLADAARRAQVMAQEALAAATEADEDAARALRQAWSATADGSGGDAEDRAMIAAITGRDVPVSGTPADEVAAWWASLAPSAQATMLAHHWAEIGNLDGIPYDVRVEANTTAITAALRDARGREADLEQRIEELRAQLPQGTQPGMWAPSRPGLLQELANLEAELGETRADGVRYDSLLNGSARRYDADGVAYQVRGHQVVIFDPEHGRFAEIAGSIGPQTENVAMLVGGTGTNGENMDGQFRRAMTFVQAARPKGSLAVITYLGGPMPQNLTEAPLASFATDQAGAMREFVSGIDRPSQVPVTVVAHSYGGSVVGAAESVGMVADRILHVESAGAGPGVSSVTDYAAPSTLRYSMTAPGDVIGAIQGVHLGALGHGADPDLLQGVVRLETGRNDADDPRSGIVQGPSSHSDVFRQGTTAWKNMLAVMTGDRVELYTEPSVQTYPGNPPVTVVSYPMEDPEFVAPTADVP